MVIHFYYTFFKQNQKQEVSEMDEAGWDVA